jgi:large subunit ribosomal protein L1
MSKHGKKYTDAVKLIEPGKEYAPKEAMELLLKVKHAKFDETVDVHMRLGVDPRHADQQVRGVVLLPSGTGKKVRILVFAEGEAARIAQEAGADIVGLDDIIAKIQQENWLEFDTAVAVQQVMGKVSKLGRILGSRGLMPNPKAGTLVQNASDLPRVIKELRMGRVEFKVDKTACLHVPIGKSSFTAEQLLANFAALADAVNRAKPASLKGQYIRRIAVTTTMGPGIRVDPMQAINLGSVAI